MGSVVLTAATSGGAVVPVIMSAVNDSRGIRYGFCVPLAFFAFGLLLPLYATVTPTARQQVDPVRKRSDDKVCSDRPSTPKRIGRVLSGAMIRGKRPSDQPTTEHVEGKREQASG